MRVLSVITTSSRRGAEVFAVDLADELARRGTDLEVVALAEGEGDHRLEVEVLGRSRRGPGTIAALRRRLVGVDAVVAHGSTTLPVTALATLGTGVPFVYRNVGDPRYWASTRRRRGRTSWAMGRAARIVALTAETAVALGECYGVPPEKTSVIPKGTPSSRFPPTGEATRAARRRQLGLPDGPVALFAGALSPEKRPDLAVEAVAAAASRPTLVLAGNGARRDELERLGARLLPGGRCRLVGQVGDLSPWLQAADLLVVPSDTEGLPGVAIEAGMTGIPVVATDVGWVGDIVVDGRTGFLVPRGSVPALADAIDRALGQGESLGAAGREHCLAGFDIEAVATRWLEVLTGVVEG